eukprot:scaffold91568_cov27-Phaeocystis_antarctica.AAC.1
MGTQSALGVTASMKRDGAEFALARLERVRRTPQWDCSHRYQAPSQGGRALPCLVKITVLRRQAVLLEAILSRPFGRGPCCNASLCQSVDCCMWSGRRLAARRSVAA